MTGLESRIIPLTDKTSVLPPSRDRQHFPGFYAEYDAADQADRASIGVADESEETAAADEEKRWVCVGPIAYDPTAIQRDIADLKAALEPYDVVDAFLPVVAPASTYWLDNEHYATDEEFVYALADALHEEYKAIVDAGFYVQVDDAVLMH